MYKDVYVFYGKYIKDSRKSFIRTHWAQSVQITKQYNLEGIWETGKANERGYFINNLEYDWFQNVYTNGAYHIEGALIG